MAQKASGGKPSCASPPSSPTTADLRGIDNVGKGIAWASGTNGTVLRTEDAGYLWQRCTIPPNAEHLDFRGIQAFDANTAIVMSSGPGDQSPPLQNHRRLPNLEAPLHQPRQRRLLGRAATTPPHGYRSAVAYDPTTKTWITVGPNGTDISTDDGRNWRPLHPTNNDAPDADQHWNALSLPYAVGPHGRIGGFSPRGKFGDARSYRIAVAFVRSGFFRTRSPQAAGTFAICFANTLNPAVPGCSVAQ
jgi:hypothetical protein